MELEGGKEHHLKFALAKIRARLWVATHPQDAGIRLLNHPAGFTQGMELEPGGYEVEISATGYETKQERVDLEGGKDQHLQITLKKIRARLRVETDVKNAVISIVNPPMEFAQGMELEPGRYEVAAAADGIVPHTKWIELQAGAEGRLSFRLLPDKGAAIGAQKTAVSPAPKPPEPVPEKIPGRQQGSCQGLAHLDRRPGG